MESRAESNTPRSSVKKSLIGLLAPEEHLPQLFGDIGSPKESYDRLILTHPGKYMSPWAQNVWENPVKISFRSISEAANKLREIQRNWVLYPFAAHRRAQLIQESLPHITFKKITLGDHMPTAPLGSWTLLENNLLLASSRCSSPYPNGELHFHEDNDHPPSRAYLKLWEVFTLMQQRPGPGDHCLDAGACPGGWTWVLSESGANVVAIDRSPLSPPLMKHPKVRFVQGNAFLPEHDKLGPFNWIFSDVACYPEKLYEWVEEKLQVFPDSRFVCTLKFQGTGGYGIVKKFEAIPHSKVLHLFHNKHELTWVRGF